MAKQIIALKIKLDWVDKWLFIPYVKTRRFFGFYVDVDNVLQSIEGRLIIKVIK